MKFRLSGVVLAALAYLFMAAAPAAAQTSYVVIDGNRVPINFAATYSGGIYHPRHVFEGLYGGVPTAVNMTTAGAFDVTIVGGAAGGGLTDTQLRATAVPVSGTFWQATQPVSGPLTDAQLRAVAVPVSVSGGATAANQGTEITSLGTIATNSGTQATAANQTSVIGTKAAGTAAASSVLTGGVYNASAPTLTTGQQAALQMDSAGALKVSGAGGGTQYAEDSVHVSGDLGTVALVVRKDTATQIARTDGDYTALITDANGRLHVNVGADAVQGTTSDTSSSNTMFGALLAIKAAAADTTTPTPVKIDQTTVGTTDSVTVKASELHKGEVGGNQITVQVAQTVTAASAYASGNAIGGLMTVAGAARVSGSAGAPGTSGLLQSVVANMKSAQTSQIDIFLFSSNPTASTCTDKTAFALNAADFDKVLGVASIPATTAWFSGGTVSVGQVQNAAIPYALVSATSIYACAVTRATPTYTATTDVSFGFRFVRN